MHNAWLRTIEDGIHTRDVYRASTSIRLAGTRDFAAAVIERLDERPTVLQAVDYQAGTGGAGTMALPPYRRRPAQKALVGVDVFVHAADVAPAALADRLKAATTGALTLQMITNRGVKVWPNGHPETFCTDHWRCRFVPGRIAASATATSSPCCSSWPRRGWTS